VNPKISLAMHMALDKIRKGASVRQAAAETGLWPQSVYLACKREGLMPAGYKPRRIAQQKGGA
jgi:hypothetical protein